MGCSKSVPVKMGSLATDIRLSLWADVAARERESGLKTSDIFYEGADNIKNEFGDNVLVMCLRHVRPKFLRNVEFGRDNKESNFPLYFAKIILERAAADEAGRNISAMASANGELAAHFLLKTDDVEFIRNVVAANPRALRRKASDPYTTWDWNGFSVAPEKMTPYGENKNEHSTFHISRYTLAASSFFLSPPHTL